MIVATLIFAILTFMATVAIPLLSKYNNRLQLDIALKDTNIVNRNGYYNLLITLHIKNASKFQINIHKIELQTQSQIFFGQYDYKVIKNKIIDENEECTLQVVFEQIPAYYLEQPKKVIVFTNKKNYSFTISGM